MGIEEEKLNGEGDTSGSQCCAIEWSGEREGESEDELEGWIMMVF